MIYTCEHCGAWFSGDMIKRAIAANETIIVCKSCGQVTQFREVQESSIARGYNSLSLGEFNNAMSLFSSAIADSKKFNKAPSPDAYLGYALGQWRVQTIFSEADPNKLNLPQLVCHTHNEMYFSDNANYLLALQCSDRGGDERGNEFTEEGNRLRKYAETIDAIKDHYEEEERRHGNGFSYSVFISYEDEPEDGESNQGYTYAKKVKNALPPQVADRVFLPDIEDPQYMNDKLRYEAAILYAIHHSKCMLVIADNNIDFRLTNIYSRYYFANGYDGNKLGFVRYLDRIPIRLPDEKAAGNIFDFDSNKEGFRSFVAENNNIIINGPTPGPIGEPPKGDGKTDPTDTPPEVIDPPKPGEKVWRRLSGGQIAFGSYPQKRVVDDPEVLAYFNQFPVPSFRDSKDWIPLYISRRTQRPYTWYRDGTVNGKRYRAVYFTRPRDVFSVQSDSDTPAREQKKQGYYPETVHVFAFRPIIWKTIEQSMRRAVLHANCGIDSMEFNSAGLGNEWESSTIRQWLNSTFLETAFNEEEREHIFYDGDDRVFLMDRDIDIEDFTVKKRVVLGSDYCKCLGGMCRQTGVNSYWVFARDNCPEGEAVVTYPGEGISSQYVDSTIVAIVPKINLNLS